MNDPQTTSHILMVRPSSFGFNTDTAMSNVFQAAPIHQQAAQISLEATKEFDELVHTLVRAGIQVMVVEDTPQPVKPDAVFPNNWFTTHSDGTFITYPMQAPNRRAERREDIVTLLEASYQIKNRYSFEHDEQDGKILEGTGSMILDRKNKLVYACLSPRTNPELLERFALIRQYEKIVFNAFDPQGIPVYHTNVIMALGEDIAVVCMSAIRDENEKKMLLEAIGRTEKKLVDLSWEQVLNFAGNMIQLRDKENHLIWVMSESARSSLTPDQLLILRASGDIISSPIPTIEKYGGGSVRCMIAEIFLPVKKPK